MRPQFLARIRPVASFFLITFLVACSGGGGCSGCGGAGFANIKGGYPVSERKENAIQLRITQGFFAFLMQNGGALVRRFLPAGGIPVPSRCGGDTEICCGQACKVNIDVTSIQVTPQPPRTLRVMVRTRLSTAEDMNVKIKQGFITLRCGIRYNSARRGAPDVGISAAVNASVNPQTRLTSLDVDNNSVDIHDLDDSDLEIKGNLACDIANLLKGLFIDPLKDQLKKQIAGPLDEAFCQRCTNADECSSLANQGCNKYCMRNGACMQRLGVEGRLDAAALLGGLSHHAKGSAIDLYAVSGGYTDVEPGQGGLSLGMLGGARSVGRSACVPERPAPMDQPPPKAAALATNLTPSGKAYHVGAGISTLELNLLGHSLYETGGLCLSLGTPQVALLNSGTLSTLIRSLDDITRGKPASVFIVMRPQNPPTFALGKGTYKPDGMGGKTLDDPLLKLGMKDFALDFYLYMDERYVRMMRLTADLNVPLGLDTDGQGRLLPLLGDVGQALQNVRVTDTALLKESPLVLSALFPKLLPILLGQVASSLKPIALPDLMGFKLRPVEITSLDGQAGKRQLLGLFLELGLSGMGLLAEDTLPLVSSELSPAETSARLVSLSVPPASRFSLSERHDPKAGPRAVLYVDGRGSGTLEYQVAVDGGLWRPFFDGHEITIDDPVLGLPGEHHIEVRARVAGAPGTLDPTPARVSFLVMPPPDQEEGADAEPLFHGRTPGEMTGSGCASCHHTGRAPGAGRGALLLAALSGVLVLARRRRIRGPGGLILALALAGGLSACGKGPIGGEDLVMVKKGPPPKAGDFFSPDDEIGRYQSAVPVNRSIYLSAYNSTFGDLAFAEVEDMTKEVRWQVVDGLPEEPPADVMDGAPRLGHTEAGPDVGRFTSMAFAKRGVPVIAYQDATSGAVRFAVGPPREWQISVVDEPRDGAQLGLFTTLSLDQDDVPTVAYMATGLRRENGKVYSQLIVAQASSATPAGKGEWQKRIVEEVEIPCAGFCRADEACVRVGEKQDPQPSVCRARSDRCMGGCASGKACVENACVDALPDSPAQGIPEGTGLFARLVRQGEALHVVYHNRTQGALRLATAPEYAMPMTIDGGDGKSDMGQHLGVAAGEDGTLHIAYLDAVRDHLLYRTIKDGVAGKVEVVDDGLRAGEAHAVGAGATVFLDGSTVRIAYQDQTAGSLELSSRADPAMGWTRETKGQGARGFYPQAVRVSGTWVLIDVVYDRVRDIPLSAIAFSPL